MRRAIRLANSPAMTIGILTIHTGYHEGATLQALALALMAQEVTGEAAEILDHRHVSQTEAHHGPPSTARRRAIAAFRDSVLPLSPTRFIEDPRAAWAYARENYRALIVGSEEVWKIAYRTRLRGLIHAQSDPRAPSFPNAYWPDASAGLRRVAYGATVGTKTDWRRIPFFRRWQIARRIEGFEAIGLRDERTRAFLGAVAPKAAARAERVPDPTLGHDLLPYASDQIAEILAAQGVDPARPRALVVAGRNPKVEALMPELARMGIATVALSYPTRGVALDLSEAGLSPLEWAASFGHFDLVVTDRMHGGLFALRAGTPLLFLDARRPTMGLATKNAEIAKRFAIEDFYFPLDSSRTSPPGLARAAARAMGGDWPREAIAARIAQEARIARRFLAEALAE